MKLRFHVLFFMLSGFHVLHAEKISYDLNIKTGYFQTAHSDSIPYLSLSEGYSFSPRNVQFSFRTGDSVSMKIRNLDTSAHQFIIDVFMANWLKIPAGDSANYQFHMSEPGVFLYYDSINFPFNNYMGFGGMITVSDYKYSSFKWNLKEIQSSWNKEIAKDITVDISQYEPDYFFINDRANPQINMDSSARITGTVGDTILVYIGNSGHSIHAIHFHGYHAELMFSSTGNSRIGWMKDTHAIYPGETVILRIVPDKPGEYPVHDHNLVAVTGGGLYPNGMFTTILIIE